ncbi:MAG: hypothetical protein N0A16_13410 [Blastocatellia bacterium]|nr:hypothetical protein [Blastocatellia bacterium]MDW8110215.1 hypothetical protein [Candidatus Bipolaricaulota bacterium]
MLRRISGASSRRVSRRVLLATVLLAVALSFKEAYFVPVAQAEPFVTVRVVIERLEGEEFGENPDFYAVITIDGEALNNKAENDRWEDKYNISPNWEFSKRVDLARGSIPITVEIWDEDGFSRFEDDHVDINPNRSKRNLGLTVNLRPCSVAGDISGGCDLALTSNGTGEERAMIRFRIVVEAPPIAPGLRVSCIHNPIWPQATDRITFTANALDGALFPRSAYTIEIWVNDRFTPARRCIDSANCTVTLGPFSGTVSYGCRVLDEGLEVWSGWRVVQIGNPSRGRAVPIIFTGGRSSRIDIVFIPDRDNYSGANDPRFLNDVRSVIENAYYREDLFLSNQDKFNFWIALDMGDAEPDCEHEPPGNWDDAYTFADVGALVHTDMFRDCAPGGMRVFSSEPTELRTFIHETGHVPFGLADEYCCDGGYFQQEVFPNVYEEPEDCRADASSFGRTAAACREFEEVIDWWFDQDWSVSDPATNDLMVDNGMPQAADVRRINYIFDECRRARC